jgi:5'-deoxynucleotidase YfbR-like HD superfamily hydrolase
MSLDAVLGFCRLLMQFQAVERYGAEAPVGFRENDAEHSYSLAMMAWYLIDTAKLELDTNLSTQYALAHDLVEVYAGDTHAFGSSPAKASKKLREDLALNLLGENYPEFPILPQLIHAYEQRQDAESRFIYALDKLMPSLMIYLNESHQYVSRQIPYNDVVAYVEPKAALDPTINTLWIELKPRLAARPELFS